MWIVQLALRRKFTFVVMALFIALLGILTIFRTPTDIFPVIDVPVVSVIWSYNGLPAKEIESRIVTISERAMTTTVNDIEHIESQSYPGIGVIKIFFQPGADPKAAVAQVTAICQTIIRPLPPGITPPLIVQYSASSVPVLQLGVGSKTLSETQLFDQATNFIRTQLATVQGASVPLPYGGSSRLLQVDLDLPALQSKGLSPSDVLNAVSAQNLILPSGTIKVGTQEYNVRTNAQPGLIDEFNDMPVKVVNGSIIRIGDVAFVHEGHSIQQNIVNQNGRRGVLLTVLKNGGASTLSVVNRIKEALPRIKATLPKDLELTQLFDQSLFVRASVFGVVREAAIAALLTALMILLFLGSWRSTLVVATSIPLSLFCSLILLAALGQTINIMTLGGLSLAVGILVDDATVEIENTNRNLAQGGKKTLTRAILDGASQIAVPTFVATLTICIVFVPVVFLTGAAKSLFQPLAMAVVFAMASSYLLSRTLVPVMVQFLLKKDVDRIRAEEAEHHEPEFASLEEGQKGSGARGQGPEATGKTAHENARVYDAADAKPDNKQPDAQDNADSKPETRNPKPDKGDIFWRIHHQFNRLFERFRDAYLRGLVWALTHRKATATLFIVFFLISFCLTPFIGRDFFPNVDAGQINLHVQGPPGTRLEETAHLFAQVEEVIHKTIPAKEIDTTLDNIGLVGGVNLAYSNSATLGSLDGDILVSLKEGKHGPTDGYIDDLRRELNKQFPGVIFYFQPADITTQILNFGLPAPIDVQVVGRDPGNYKIAEEIANKAKAVPGAVDVHIHQLNAVPEFNVNVDRERSQLVGLTERDVASSMLLSLTGSGQTSPSFWLDPKNGVSYSISVQTPQREMSSVSDLLNTPIGPTASSLNTNAVNSIAGQNTQELLSNLATIGRGASPQIVNHYNVQPTFDVYISASHRDLGGVAADVSKIIAAYKGNKLPRGSSIVLRGQVESMNSSFLGLGLGMIFAIALVYLLMVVNFQSWIDPLVIIMALPGALSGILWILFITQTTFNVPSLMGAIMSIGVATSNSILLVTFANEYRAEDHHRDATQAAQAAGYTRLRPVMMTALALLLGMLPMALGLGEGGEQNAPLGRAVIGGATVATMTTLFFVPLMYTILRRHPVQADAEDIEIDRFIDDEANKRKKKREDDEREVSGREAAR